MSNFPSAVAQENPSVTPSERLLRVGVEIESEPFTFTNGAGMPSGFCVDLLKEVAADQQLHLQFIGLPWTKILEEFKAGRLDIIANIAYLPERTSFADFTDPHTTLHGELFLRAGTEKIQRIEDLKKLRVATSRETLAYQFLRLQGWESNLVLKNSLREGVSAVQSGEADAFIGIGLITEKIIRDGPFPKVVPSEISVPGLVYELHWATHKGETNLLYQLNLGLYHSHQSGRFDELSDRWLGPIRPRHIRWSDAAPYWIPLLLVAIILGLAVWRQRKLMQKLHLQTAALRTSEERLRLALVGSREAVWDWDVATNRIVRNDRWSEMLGVRSDEISANIDGVHAWVHPQDLPRLRNFRNDLLQGESRIEYRIRSREGTWRWVFDRGAVVARSAEGEPLRITGIATDVTARKQTEEALTRSQLLLEQSQETAQIGGWEYDLRTVELYWTKQCYRIHDVDTPPPRLTLDWSLQFFTPAAQSVIGAAIDRASRDGTVFDLEVEMVTAKSRLIWVRASGRAESEDGRVVKLHGTIQEITKGKKADEERQKLQLKMLEAQKLESLGVLAGGIAHDFNNLLTVILGNTSLAREDTSSVPEALEQIEIASQRAADLCRQMLAYAGKGRFSIEVQDLNAVVYDTVQLLKLSISKTAALDFTFDTSILPLEADSSQIRQVVMNLVINASEALAGANGRIRVSTTRETLTKERLREARLGQDVGAGDFVGVQIQDDGCGMSSDTMSRIFDPFFTTKFTGRGLGLAAVVGVIRAHRGALFLSSTVGKGTSFRIFFPRTTLPLPSTKGSSVRSASSTTTKGSILLVDDEANVRRVATALLERQGYNVAVAADGYEALALALAHGGKFAAVLLDLTMPGLDGPATLKELRAVNPDIPILLMSGFTEADARRRLPSDPLISFLPKPFDAEQLMTAMSRLISKSTGSESGVSSID